MRSMSRETEALARLAEAIASGLRFDDILTQLFKSFHPLLPYDRIGIALLAEGGREVVAIGARSRAKELQIEPGYSAHLKGSSLEKLLRTGKPRIINDLRAYLARHPASESTRRIVAEGMRASLTCPLIARGKRVGFIFFSSRTADTYKRVHVESFLHVATLLSLAVENSRIHEEVAQANELKNRILGIASHDLRNPLTVMNGHLAILEEDPANSALKPELTVMKRKCKQMMAIIDGLLDSSIVESRGLVLSLGALDLGELLSHICADSEVLAEGKSIRVELKVEPGLPSVTADKFRLQQVFDNLISNAIKYSLRNRTVAISARAAEHGVEVSVADQGQGIAPQELALLFKEYGRASSLPTGGERSVGLGLSIADRIVKAHGGTIKVDSALGVGTTFTVHLPLQAGAGGKAVLDLR